MKCGAELETQDRISLTRTLATPAGRLPRGRTLAGKFKILQEIGRGGMGVVYKAVDTQLKRTVALKFLSRDSTGIPSSGQRLIQEAQTASALNHPNICTIYEIGEAEGQAYIAMEFLEGRSLDRLIPSEGMPPDDVLRFGGPIVEALEYAHGQGVIHRDLKTANVVITTAGRVKILDFGLAKRLPGEEIEEARLSRASLTEEGVIAGTLPYLAPETLQGYPADVRSDIWALGVVLYEMAAGARPFQGRTGFELTSAILRDAPAPLPERIPDEQRAVILKCLEKDLTKRFQTAGEVRAALPGEVSAKSRGAAGLAFGLRRRRVRWIMAAAALCLVGALIALLTPRIGERLGIARERTVLSTGARPSPVAEANEYFEKGMFFSMAQFNLDSARKMFERALELDPKFAEARGWYGFTFILEIDSGRSNDSGWLARAEQELKRALQDDPGSARAHSSLAALFFYQGRKDLMPAEVKKALELNPDEIDAKIWWSNYHLANGEYASARTLLNQLLKREPLFIPSRMLLGDILRMEGDIAGAIREQGKILEQDPGHPYAVQKLARAYLDGNDLAAARRTLETLAPEDQGNFEIRWTWALLLAMEGRTSQALEKVDEDALKAAALSVWVTSEAADFYAVIGDSRKALEWLEKAVRNGDERDAWFRRDPLLAPLRDHPRFKTIVDSIGFRRSSHPRGT